MKRAVACAVLAALAAAAGPGATGPKRVVEFAISLAAVQTTSWTAHGAYAWCDSSAQRLPFDGSGQATLRVALPAGTDDAFAPGGPAALGATLTGTVETTTGGVGAGATLADARRTQPHGHLLRFGGPIAWLVDGPGRRRTAFMVFRGVVQSVDVGCRQTDRKERGAPVDDAAVC